MSLTTAQRQAALAYLATISDDMLASFTWQSVGYNDDISADVAEVAAVHCDNVVAHSMLHYDDPNAEHQANARSNVKTYGNRARTLDEIARYQKSMATIRGMAKDMADGRLYGIDTIHDT